MVDHERAPVEDCDTCGFRWDDWSHEQAAAALDLRVHLLQGVLDGVDPELANTRPQADMWSILEYVDHVRHAMWMWRFEADAAVAEPGVDLRTGGVQVLRPEVTRFDDVTAAIATAGD